MDEHKRAAKEFVDKYFPVKQQPTSLSDVLDKVGLPSNSPAPESSKKQGYAGAEGESSSSTRKLSTLQNGSINPVAFCQVPASSLVGSTVSYGSREYYYPNPPPATRHPAGDSNYYEGIEDRKDGREEYKGPENQRGEWWQGSYNY